MLKVISEDTLIDTINNSTTFKIEISDRLISNMIMYTVIELRTGEESKFLVYRRPHKDSVFHDKWSIGVGGSMELYDVVSNQGKVDKFKSLMAAGIRELNEEITLSDGEFSEEDVSFLGYIDGHPKAIVAHVRLPKFITAKVNEPENEGKGFYSLEELSALLDNFEPWSQMVIEGLGYLLGKPSMESTERVTWKDIPGYKQYEVNAKGELRNKKTQRISKGGNAGRYLKVSVYPDGSKVPHLEYLHILVCKAYHGTGSKGQVVLHKNNIRSDVRPSNLKWGSQSDNIQEAYDDGLIKK